jgi:hypothetical protein
MMPLTVWPSHLLDVDTLGLLLLAGVLALTVTLYARGSRVVAPMLAALLAGPLCYFGIGVLVPLITGEGHFFSVPFGGLGASDRNMLLSLVLWCVAAWAVLRFIAVSRRRDT